MKTSVWVNNSYAYFMAFAPLADSVHKVWLQQAHVLQPIAKFERF